MFAVSSGVTIFCVWFVGLTILVRGGSFCTFVVFCFLKGGDYSSIVRDFFEWYAFRLVLAATFGFGSSIVFLFNSVSSSPSSSFVSFSESKDF